MFYNLIGIECVYKLATDMECFAKAIKGDLKYYLRQNEYNSIIHISAHGFSERDGKDWTAMVSI